jgi:hypothetical protein
MTGGKNLTVLGGTDEDDKPLTGEVIDKRAAGNDDEDEGFYLSAQDILTIDDVVTQVVLVPEWSKNDKPGKIILQSLDGDHRDRYLNSMQYVDGKGRQRFDMKGANARLLAMSAVRTDGQPLFKLSQVEALQARNAAVVERLAKIARKMSGISDTDDDDEEQRRREGLD